jgi:broad specificity phosphatase PhoE
MNSINTRIFIVRHGESEHNIKKIISGGKANPKLTDTGREQALKAKQKFKGIKIDVIYSSDLDRAIETAEIISGKSVPPQNRISELRERDFGSLESKSEHLLKKGNTKKLELPHAESWVFKHVEDMESDDELSNRFVAALEKVAKSNPGKTILIVTHGGAIRTTIVRLIGPNTTHINPGSIKNTDVIELIYDGNKLKIIKLPEDS